jgi:hypothetical protein
MLCSKFNQHYGGTFSELKSKPRNKSEWTRQQAQQKQNYIDNRICNPTSQLLLALSNTPGGQNIGVIMLCPEKGMK